MSYRPLSALFFVALAWAAQAAPPPPQQVRSVEGITEYRLANGLQVLLAPDDSKPTTTVNMTYRVGSRNENYGETGMAHLLEHLLFKGSPKYRDPKADFASRGLRYNGSTSFDRTNYFASFAANDDTLKFYLAWQADAMVNSFVARKDLDTEMTVVRNEMERGENDPQRILYQRGLAAMYQWHNYGKDTIGARSDVENVDIAHLQAFYRTYYQPDNATLVISGKFDPPRVLAWIQNSFGAIPAPKRTLPRLYTTEPVQDGERDFTLRRSGGVPLLLAGYRTAAGADPDFAAVEVLTRILGDEPSGRLYKQLVQTQRVASVGGWAQDLADPGLMMFMAELAPGQDVDAARAAMLATLESFAAEPVTAEELERAKTAWLNGWTRSFTNAETVGLALSETIAQGDWRLFFLQRDRVRAVTLADVQRVATEYLLPANRVLGVYLPTEQPQRAPASRRVDLARALSGYTGDPVAAQAEAFDPTPANLEARTQRTTLPGGMKVALLPKGSRGQVVQAVLSLHYGDEKTLFGSGDVPTFTAAMLDHGTAKLTRQQIHDRFEALDARVRFSGGAGQIRVSIQTKRDSLAAVIALVGEILREASFPAPALEEVRQQVLAEIESRRKEPEVLADHAIDRHADPYPPGDVRHARSFDEAVAGAKAVTLEQVRSFHARFFGAANAEFGASGEMDPALVRSALEAAFKGWNSALTFARVPTPWVDVAPARFMLRTPDKQNAAMIVRLALPLTDADADYAAFTLANRILGQGGNSRLWQRVRERDGLSYGVGSDIDWSSHEPNSTWQASAIFAPQNQPRVEAAFREEVARALKDGFTQRELDEARAGLLSARRLARAQDAVLAGALNRNLYLGRTFEISQRVDDAIAAATLGSVNAALRKYLKPERFVFAFGGDFKAGAP